MYTCDCERKTQHKRPWVHGSAQPTTRKTFDVDNDLILDRYRPITEAGSGGFGTVVVAWDTRIQRRVAIKQMQLESAEDGTFDAVAQAGLEEARTAAMLQDTSIVGILDFEVHGSTAYLIMEYVDGITLTQLMRHYGDHVNPDLVAAIFAGVARALQVAHGNQVLHLDIKPDNIIINRQGVVKVTDFGLAKLADAAGFSHAGGGTIGYMPLEQMRMEPLDARCDEWALASVTYQMITGENPFFAKDLAGAEAAILNAELMLPSLCMNLPEDVDDVLFYALDPDSEERYASVTDFAEELLPLLGDARRGRKQLARIVGQAHEDIPEPASVELEQPETRRRRRPGNLHVLLRLWAMAGSGVLAAAGLANVAWLDGLGGLWSPYAWGILAAICLLAAFFPHLGVLLATCCMAAALASQGFYLLAGGLGLAAVAWWALAGRNSLGNADAATTPVLFGAVGAGQATPFLLGYFMDVKEAVVSALFCTVLALYLAAMGSASLFEWWPHLFWQGIDAEFPSRMLEMLKSWQTWVLVASWILATMLMSALCSRVGRVFAVLGCLLAGSALGAGLAVCAFLESGYTSWMPELGALGIVAACTIGAIVLCLVREPD